MHIIVSGRVQGVFFRAGAKQKADELRVFGWVKNTDDGRLEAVLEGDKIQVAEMIEWFEVGPQSAQVAEVEVEEEVYQGEFQDFKILVNNHNNL